MTLTIGISEFRTESASLTLIAFLDIAGSYLILFSSWSNSMALWNTRADTWLVDDVTFHDYVMTYGFNYMCIKEKWAYDFG